MNVTERSELGQLKQCVQNLALQVARLNQAIEPLMKVQEDQNNLRDRVSELEGFKSAMLWLVGFFGGVTIVRVVAQI